MENHVEDRPVSEDLYRKFDAQIFEITKIQLDFSLTDGQKKELMDVAEKIEAAYQGRSLSDASRHKLLRTIADCGLELPAVPAEQVSQGNSRQNKKLHKARGGER